MVFNDLRRRTGDIVCSTVALSDDDKNELLKSGPVRCAAVDSLGRYIATSGDDKVLKVWSLEELKLLSCRFVSLNHGRTESSNLLLGKCQKGPPPFFLPGTHKKS
jgi:WD40 repeat protein